MAGRKAKAGTARKRKKKNIIRFPGGMHMNIGVVVFLFIAFYMVYNVYSYMTQVHIKSYEVVKGTIEVNTSYTGLIIRKESIVTAQQSGKLDFYLKDHTKASKGTLLCSVDENGNISERLNEAVDSSSVLTKENMGDIHSSIRDYAKGYKDLSFYSTYNFKSDLSGQLMEAVNLSALGVISEYTAFAQDNQTFHLYHAQEPGVVAYYTDGMENLSIDALSPELFDQSSHNKQSLKTEGAVQSGQPLYKLITDENWQIAVQLDQAMKNELQGGEVTQIRFKDDQTTAWADYTIERKGGADYLILSLRNGMIRYADERYIDINILLDQQTGLKIPNSSIATKTFELVPNSYLTTDNSTSSSQTGLFVEHRQQNGSYSKAVFVPVTVYYVDRNVDENGTEDENRENWIAYISEEKIKRGDRIARADSTDRYEVKNTATLRGVYNINRGYAVFRQIEPIFSNDNYTIVKTQTTYGITQYDHIALDGDSVSEGQIIMTS
ncbi:MAG: hypothetical protein K2N87_20870 [Eubacterium sp.]|nr:hypothetical protein [Eubacterium sp.]